MKKKSKRMATRIIAYLLSLLLLAAPFNSLPAFADTRDVPAAKAQINSLNTGTPTKAVLASAVAKGSNPNNAIDGNTSNYWETPLPNSMDDSKRHIDIRLDALYDLTEVKIWNPTSAYYHYQVYASSDGENFTKIAYKNNNSNGTATGDTYNVEGLPGTENVGFIRVNVSFASNQTNSGSRTAGRLSEVEVWGVKHEDSVLPTRPELVIRDFEDTHWADEYKLVENNQFYARQKTAAEMTAMVGRVIGDEWKDSFTFVVQDIMEDGKDAFEVGASGGKAVIRGRNGVSLASGFNYYLKNFCRVNYNPLFAGGGVMPAELPDTPGKIIRNTNYDERYVLNFCTFSYTMSFWNWDEYEAYLDWAAMNGINLMLNIVGQEEVLRRVLKKYNYTEQEVRDYISGPAYYAWFYMQNMYGFGGPLSDNWFEQRVELARRMHDRMQTLGIRPVLQGFSGQIPTDFVTKNPGASVVTQGNWCGFQRPNMLNTLQTGSSGYFPQMAVDFYRAQQEVFGEVTDYYAVDPFHEGGNVGGMDVARVYEEVLSEMLKADPNGIWVIQQWQSNVTSAKLSRLNKNHVLVLDLTSEARPENNTMESNGTKWVWNMLHNFGGRMGLFGDLPAITAGPPKDYAAKNYMVGIGTTMEAYSGNAIAYDIMGDMTWTNAPVSYTGYVKKYAHSRYGKDNPDATAAWNILAETAYGRKTTYVQGSPESVINWRPQAGSQSALPAFGSASTWGHSNYMYDKQELEKALPYFIAAYDDLKDSSGFIYDFAELSSQVLSTTVLELYNRMRTAYSAKNIDDFDLYSDRFLDGIRLIERIYSTTPDFGAGKWIAGARKMLPGMDDWSRDLFEFNARALITTWGGERSPELRDYSNRMWSGLTGGLYLKRWESAVTAYRTALVSNSSPSLPNYFRMEWEWANRKSDESGGYYSCPTEASGEDLKALAQLVFDQYSLTNIDGSLEKERVNLALGKTVTATPAGTGLANLTDGDLGTVWEADAGTWPVELTVDLEGFFNIEAVAFAPMQANSHALSYKIEVLAGGVWTTVAEELNDDDYGYTGILEHEWKGKAEKVRYTIDKRPSMPEGYAPHFVELMVYADPDAGPKYVNLALNKAATHSGGSNPAGGGNDGNVDTNAGNTGSGPYWWRVDLGEIQEIHKVELDFKPGDRTDWRYKIEYSADDSSSPSTWHTIVDYSVTPAPTNTYAQAKVFDEPIQARHFRVTKNGVPSGTSYWYVVWEFRAFGLQTEALPEQPMKQLPISRARVNSWETSSSDAYRIDALFDGDPNTFWHARWSSGSSWTGNVTRGEALADIDLGRERTIRKIELDKRVRSNGYDPVMGLRVLRHSDTGGTFPNGETMSSYTAQNVSSSQIQSDFATTGWEQLTSGINITGLAQASLNTQTVTVTFDPPIEARYLRFGVLCYDSASSGSSQGFAQVSEIRVYDVGEPLEVRLLDYINQIVRQANQLPVGTLPGDVPQSARNEFNAVVNSAVDAAENLSSEDDLQTWISALNAALETLRASEIVIIKSGLLAALSNAAIYNSLNKYGFNALMNLLPYPMAQTAYNNINASQDSVNTAAENLNLAMQNNAEALDLGAVCIELLDLAETRSGLAVIGSQPGNYPQGAKTALDAAISTAKSAAPAVSAVPALEAIANALRNAIDTFNVAKIPGDLTVTPPEFEDLPPVYEQPGAKPIVIKNETASAMIIESVTVSGTAFEVSNQSTDISRFYVGPNADNSTWTVRPTVGLTIGVHTAVITVTYSNGATAEADCGVTVLDTLTPEISDFASATLDGTIGINWFTVIPEEYKEDAAMKFTYKGRTKSIPFKEATLEEIEGKPHYKFTYYVPAKEMTEAITAQLIGANDEELTEAVTRTIKGYADALLETNIDGEMRELVEALLNYGGYAQTYFGYTHVPLANEGLERELPDLAPVDFSSYALTLGTEEETAGVSWYGSSLILNSNTSIRHYITVTAGAEGAYMQYEDGRKQVQVPLTKYSGNIYYADINNIGADRLKNTFDVRIFKNGSAISKTRTYSAYTYVGSMFDKNKDLPDKVNLLNVIAAIYDYAEQAEAYISN